jgi:hypothetical protein
LTPSSVLLGEPEAVLITGIYGTGKTTVTEEIAELLEAADVPYAAIDLDWLGWANTADDHGAAAEGLLLRNLAAVVANDREAGMTRFVLAGSAESPDEVQRLAAAIDMPMRVVRLSAPIEVIERRLAAIPTTGRRADLDQVRRAVADDTGEGIGDLTLDSDRPVGELAIEILDWVGWLRSG